MTTTAKAMTRKELTLDEMELVNGGWDWSSFGLGATVGSMMGGLVAGGVAAGLVASGPVGWCILGGALAGGAALGSYTATLDD